MMLINKNYLVIFFMGYFQATHATPTAYLRLFCNTVDNYIEKPVESSVELLDTTCYNKDIPTVIVIHGFGATPNGTHILPLIQALIDAKRTNVLVYNYEKVASYLEIDQAILQNLSITLAYLSYGISGCIVNGLKLGMAVEKMHKTGKLLVENLTIIGHSLGAQVAAYCGMYTVHVSLPIARISGCDPTKEGFDPPLPTLSTNCAQFVDIMLTDLIMAVNKSNADVNIKVNFDRFLNGPSKYMVQPGCEPRDSSKDMLDEINICSHVRNLELWAAAVSGTKLTAGKAKDIFAFKRGEVTGTLELGLDMSRSVTGDFFMETTGSPPYQPV